MEYTKLGKTGTTVSRICLGCMSYGDKKWRDWVLTSDEARQHFQVSLESGINFFDTADVYSVGVSEEITGRWLAEMASRDEVVIATKVHGPMGSGHNRAGLSRKHILEACDASLRRLKTDFIDLYQIHRFDFTTPIETVRSELMPKLSHGSLVSLAEFGHTASFWGSQPAARDRLLATFFDKGQVDASLYVRQPPVFQVGNGLSALAHRILLIAVFTAGVLIGAVWFVVRRLGRRRWIAELG